MIHTADINKYVIYRGAQYWVTDVHEPTEVYERDLGNDCALGHAMLEPSDQSLVSYGPILAADLREIEIDNSVEQI